MPQIVPNIGRDNRIATKILAAVVVVVYLIFAFTMIILGMTFLPQMEEASEETSRMIGGSDGGAVSIIQGEVIPEIRLILTLSLIIFGLLDGIFAFMLWKGRIPKSREKNLWPFTIVYSFARFFSVMVITMLTLMTVQGGNPSFGMNILYSSILVFVAVSLIIILMFKKMILGRRKATKILYSVHDEAVRL